MLFANKPQLKRFNSQQLQSEVSMEQDIELSLTTDWPSRRLTALPSNMFPWLKEGQDSEETAKSQSQMA